MLQALLFSLSLLPQNDAGNATKRDVTLYLLPITYFSSSFAVLRARSTSSASNASMGHVNLFYVPCSMFHVPGYTTERGRTW